MQQKVIETIKWTLFPVCREGLHDDDDDLPEEFSKPLSQFMHYI